MLRTRGRTTWMVAVLFAVAMIAVFGIMLAQPGQAYAAGKTKVWVVTSVSGVQVMNDEDYGASGKTTHAFKYNKNGLLVQEKSTYNMFSAEKETQKWKYDKKGNYKAYSENWGDGVQKYLLKFDKKGRVKKYGEEKYGTQGLMTAKYNGKGLPKKMAAASLKYNGKNQLVSYKTPKTSYAQGTSTTFTYSKQGALTKMTEKVGSKVYTTTFSNKYSGGRLASFTSESNATQSMQSGTLKWKKISVPKKYAAKVKAQQRLIVLEAQGATGSIPYLFLVNK